MSSDARRTPDPVAVAVAAAAIGGAGLLHALRPVRLRSRIAVSAVTLAPASLLPAAAAAAGLVAGRRWVAAAVGGLVVAGCAAAHGSPYRPSPRSALRRRRADVELTVMTANLLHGRADPDALARTVDRFGVDVLCVQEVHQAALDAIVGRVAHVLGHRLTVPGIQGAGAGIFSRFPLVDPRRPQGYGFGPVMADVAVPIGRAPGTRKITVLSFHSKAPLGNGGSHSWSDDLRRVGRLMRQHPGSLIVAGDFNATREHRQFRDLLTGGFTDAADDAGAGLLPTFPAKPHRIPLACLDHVLLGRGLTGIAVAGTRTLGSDHRAVVARIAAD